MYASFSGHVGRDSEVFTSKNGKSVLKFSVADEVFLNGKKETQWINCVDFRSSSVEKLIDYIKKGTLLHVTGEVSLHTFEKKDGTLGTSLQCVVSGIRLHGGSNKTTPPSTAQSPASNPAFDDDDIPF